LSDRDGSVSVRAFGLKPEALPRWRDLASFPHYRFFEVLSSGELKKLKNGFSAGFAGIFFFAIFGFAGGAGAAKVAGSCLEIEPVTISGTGIAATSGFGAVIASVFGAIAGSMRASMVGTLAFCSFATKIADANPTPRIPAAMIGDPGIAANLPRLAALALANGLLCFRIGAPPLSESLAATILQRSVSASTFPTSVRIKSEKAEQARPKLQAGLFIERNALGKSPA